MTFDFGPIDQQERPIVTVEPTTTQKLHSTTQKLHSHIKDTIRYSQTYNLPVKEAYQLVTGKTPSAATVSRTKGLSRNFSLATPQMQQAAHRVVFDILKGKPMEQHRPVINKRSGTPVMDPATNQPLVITDRVYPTHTNQIAAAAMVADRAEPVVRQNVNLNGNLKDFLPFRIDELG